MNSPRRRDWHRVILSVLLGGLLLAGLLGAEEMARKAQMGMPALSKVVSEFRFDGPRKDLAGAYMFPDDLVAAVVQLAQDEGVQICVQALPPGQFPQLSLHRKNRTVRELLDELVALDRRYEWGLYHGVINVLPRGWRRDAGNVLHLPVAAFSVSNEFLEVAVSDLQRQIEWSEKGQPEAYFGSILVDPDGARLTAELRQTSVQEILNSLVRQEGSHAWVLLARQEPLSFDNTEHWLIWPVYNPEWLREERERLSRQPD